MFAERGFYFTELDSEASDLYLIVYAPKKVYVAVAGEPRGVSASVETASRRFSKWIGHEFLSRQIGSIEIASSKSVSGNEHLGVDAGRNCFAVSIQKMNPAVGERLAERKHWRMFGAARFYTIRHDPHR